MPILKFLALPLLGVVLLLSAPRTAQAAESYDNCTGFITSLPAVITTQGTWCLKQDLTTSMTGGRAIDVQTNNVTIDCNGFKVDGLTAGLGTQAQGIFSDNHLNTTVRNCNVKGFLNGLIFEGTSCGGHVVEDNVFDGNTLTGIEVLCDGSVVRRNRVFDTGKSTQFTQPDGITVSYSVDILDNLVSGVTGGSIGENATGIFTYQNDGSVSGNRVRGLKPNNGGSIGSGVERGIFNLSAGRMTLRNNELMGNAGTGSLGLTCDSANARTRENVIAGFSTGLGGCSNDGGNVVVP